MTKLTVTTATPLKQEKKKEIEKKFAAKYGECTFEYVVNDALIGGMIVFDGNKIYNGSVSGQLGKLRETVKGTKQ